MHLQVISPSMKAKRSLTSKGKEEVILEKKKGRRFCIQNPSTTVVCSAFLHTMAGLSVVLETTHESRPGKKPPAQIISKATLVIHGSNKHRQASPAASSFLQRCCLCNRELAEGRDIYMYRGDRAFCSEECRRRQIFMDEDAGSNCANGAGAATASGRRRVAGGGGGGGGVAY